MTHLPSLGHCWDKAYAPGSPSGFNSSGIVRRCPFTTPTAVAVTLAVAGSWQPTALMVITAPIFAATGFASGFPVTSQNPPPNICPAQASIKVKSVFLIGLPS